MKKLKSYILTGIDPDLWKDFKAACAHYEISIRDTFVKYMQNIVKDHQQHKRMFGTPKTYSNTKGKK